MSLLHQPPILKLANELLGWVIEYVGPPDLIRGQLGWLVFTAVCKHWRDVAKSLPAWRTGRVHRHDYSCTDTMLGSDALSQLRLPQSTPITVFTMSDNDAGADWILRVACNGSETVIISGLLKLFPEGPNHTSKQMVDHYFGTLPLTGKLPSLRFAWVSSIRIHCDIDSNEDENTDFDFLTIPCIFAPALGELSLVNYVVDWRCNSLELLKIDLTDAQQLYYEPKRLLQRMGESRRTLRRVILGSCFPWRSDTMHLEEPSSAIHFHHLSNLKIRDEPRESWWFRLHMILPSGSTPMLSGVTPVVNLLRELSLGCSHPTLTEHSDKSNAGCRGALTALHFYIKPGCTGTTVSGFMRRLPHCSSCVHLRSGSYSEAEIDTIEPALIEQSKGHHVHLDQPLPFELYCEWNPAQWEMPAFINPAHAQRLEMAFDNVKSIVIRCDPELLGGNEGAATWTSVLRQVPNLSFVSFVGLLPNSLAPLLAVPALAPGLKTIQLTSRFGAAGEDMDASWILDLLKRRTEMGHPISSIGLDKTVRISGDPWKVLELHETGVCFDLNNASV